MIYEVKEEIKTKKDLIEFIDSLNIFSNNKIIVDFYGNFCSPCQKVAKYFDEIEKNNGNNICILKINISKMYTNEFVKEMIKEHQILSIPRIFLYEFDNQNKNLLFIKDIKNIGTKKALEKEIFEPCFL